MSASSAPGSGIGTSLISRTPFSTRAACIYGPPLRSSRRRAILRRWARSGDEPGCDIAFVDQLLDRSGVEVALQVAHGEPVDDDGRLLVDRHGKPAHEAFGHAVLALADHSHARPTSCRRPVDE